MPKRSVFDQPTMPRLFSLIEEVREGRLLIPDFQRPFEWDDFQRLLLFDSINRGLPIGSFLVWQTQTHDLATYSDLLGVPLHRPVGMPVRRYLLDGHQRLCTLFAALSEPATEQATEIRPIFYDPTEERLRISSREPLRDWLPLSSLFSARALWEHQSAMRERGMHEEADRVEALSNRLKDYQIPILSLISEDLDLATESFVRINEQGRAMSEAHMLQALAYSTLNLRERLGAIRDELGDDGWGEIEDQQLIDMVKANLGLSRRTNPKRLLKEISKQGESLVEILDEVHVSVARVAALLRKCCEVYGPQSLLYPRQLVDLVALDSEGYLDEESFETYFWKALLGEADGAWSSPQVSLFPPEMPREKLPRHAIFNPRSSRTKAFVLALARSNPDAASRLETLRLLGLAWEYAVHKLQPSLDPTRPESYVACTIDTLTRLRQALAEPDGPGHQELLKQHHIPEDSARALTGGDLHAFSRLRGARLDEMERVFFGRLGMQAESESKISSQGAHISVSWKTEPTSSFPTESVELWPQWVPPSDPVAPPTPLTGPKKNRKIFE